MTIIATAPVPRQFRLIDADTVRFNATAVAAARRPFVLTDEDRELVDWAQDLLDHPEQDPAAADDIRWSMWLVSELRKIDDRQLSADLTQLLTTPPPVGEFGDRVSEAFLRYSQRLIDSLTAGGR